MLLIGNSSRKSSIDERIDNKKNENTEKRKKEEKLKLKAEKEARKVHFFLLSMKFDLIIGSDGILIIIINLNYYSSFYQIV